MTDHTHDEVVLLEATETALLQAVLARWGDASNRGISRLVAGLASMVYDEARKDGASDTEAWETAQQVVVGEGMGDFEETLEDARNE